MHGNPVYVGLDVGAHKTSVVSSLGHRAVLGSAVGWGKHGDLPSAIGQSVVFGEQAIAQGQTLQVVNPFARDVVVSHTTSTLEPNTGDAQHVRDAARLLIDHSVAQVRTSPSVPIYGTLSVPPQAAQAFKLAMLDACSGTFATTLIVPAPLAVAYGLQHFDGTLVVDIGAEDTSLYAMPDSCLQEEDQVSVPLGGRTLEEYFIRLVNDAHPEAELNHAIAREVKEKFGYQGDCQRRAVVTLSSNMDRREYDLTELLNKACRSFVTSLVDAILERGVDQRATFQQTLPGHILLTGGGSRLRGIDTLVESTISEQHPITVSRVQDGVFAAATGALHLAMDAPHDCWSALHQLDRASFAA